MPFPNPVDAFVAVARKQKNYHLGLSMFGRIYLNWFNSQPIKFMDRIDIL